MSLNNKFVVLEGLDGSGTTTQLNRLKDYFSRNNIPSGILLNLQTVL